MGRLIGKHFSSHPNSGNGVHNPHLLEALLLANIGEVRRFYELPAGAGPGPTTPETADLDVLPGGEK